MIMRLQWRITFPNPWCLDTRFSTTTMMVGWTFSWSIQVLAISSSRIEAAGREMLFIETTVMAVLQTLLPEPDSRAWRLARELRLEITMATDFLTCTSLLMGGTCSTTTMEMGLL